MQANTEFSVLWLAGRVRPDWVCKQAAEFRLGSYCAPWERLADCALPTKLPSDSRWRQPGCRAPLGDTVLLGNTVPLRGTAFPSDTASSVSRDHGDAKQRRYETVSLDNGAARQPAAAG